MSCFRKVLNCKMYFIEFIVNKLLKLKKNHDDDQIFTDEPAFFDSQYENCEHVFMPIDSTNEVLACTKCGLVVNRDELKKKNFFQE